MPISRTVQILFFLSLFVSLSGAARVAVAQTYPIQPARIIVSFPPGGGTDLIARLIGQKLAERWGQNVIIENKPGGNGIVGTQVAAMAKPDGYTLYFGSSDHIILGPNLFGNLPYDTVKDFTPIVSVARQNLVLVVHPSLPAQSVKEFIALAHSRPGQLNFSSAGTGSATHLTGELFQALTEVKLTHVPYKGSAAAIVDLIAGRDVLVSFAAVAPIVPHIRIGRVRPLGVTSAVRLAAIPDVPTMAEAGVPDFEVFFWFGLFAPAGTAKEVVREVNKQVMAILGTPDVIDRIAAVGAEPTGGTPEDLSALIKRELPRWAKIIRDTGIEKTPL